MALSHLSCPFCRSILRRDSIAGREAFLCTSLACQDRSSSVPTVFALHGGRLTRELSMERILEALTQREARMNRG